MFRFPSVLLECPVCGRPVEVREEYAGQLVHCNHCRGGFRANWNEPETPGGALERADRLLRLSRRETCGLRPAQAAGTR